MSTIAEAFSIALEHHQTGHLPQAEAIYRRILEADPDQADAWHMLGVMAYQVGRFQAAIEHIGQAIQLAANRAEFYSNLGLAYQAVGRLADATACYRRAIQLHPDAAEVHFNLANALRYQGQLADAIDSYRWSLQLRPDSHAAYNNLGNALKDQGQLAEAIACYRRAMQLRPEAAQAHGNLLYTLHFCPEYSAADILAEHRRWNELHAAPLAGRIEPHANDRAPDRRLRIGYVSPDFRAHPVGAFFLPLLEAHDRSQVEVFCYSSVRMPDGLTDRCRSLADVWRNVCNASDAQVAARVRQDRIDILVDLTMHMADNRMLLFARKPAPVQVTYLAYCGTTGLSTMDYRLTDAYLDPPGVVVEYSEQSIRLPETYWCYQPMPQSPAVGPLPAASAGCVTFGCLNNFCKVSEAALVAWTRVLQATADARLVLHARSEFACQQVRELFERQGVSSERLAFVGRLPWDDYCRLYGQIDVALDPFPYGGGTTTCDALWMGVPVVSLAGRTAVGRAGLSILSNVGLGELVARDVSEYERLAVSLAQDLRRLAALRAGLRERMRRSPLTDAARFACHVEAAYRAMWRRWCAGG